MKIHSVAASVLVALLAIVAVAFAVPTANVSQQPPDPKVAPVAGSSTPNNAVAGTTYVAQPDHSTAEAIAQATALQAISQVSEKAIDAAHHSSTEAHELFEKLVWVIGALGVALTAFGVTSIRSLKKDVLAKAREQVNTALTEVNEKAKEQVNDALRQMKSEIEAVVERTKLTGELARDVLLNTAEATRSFTLARSFAEAEFDKKEYFEEAVQACLRAREAADKLGDVKQTAWTYSFEAYCRRAQNDYEGAIKAAEQSERLYKRDDPTLHYNLACYLCMAGFDDRAYERLVLAIERNTDGSIKIYAQTEKDFDRWRESGLYPDLVGSSRKQQPTKQPDVSNDTNPTKPV